MDIILGVKFFVLSVNINGERHYNIAAGNSSKTLMNDVVTTIRIMEENRRGVAYEIRVRPNIPHMTYEEIFHSNEMHDFISVDSLDDWDSLNLKRIEVEFDLMQ